MAEKRRYPRGAEHYSASLSIKSGSLSEPLMQYCTQDTYYLFGRTAAESTPPKEVFHLIMQL